MWTTIVNKGAQALTLAKEAYMPTRLGLSYCGETRRTELSEGNQAVQSF